MSTPTPRTDPAQVVQLLTGTLVGCISLGLCFYIYWGIAWLIPGAVAVVLLSWRRTRWVGIGFAAAAVGACVAVLTVQAIPMRVYVYTPPPSSPPPPNPAASLVVGRLPGDTASARLRATTGASAPRIMAWRSNSRS